MEPRQKSTNVGQVKNNSKEWPRSRRWELSEWRGGESGSGGDARGGCPWTAQPSSMEAAPASGRQYGNSDCHTQRVSLFSNLALLYLMYFRLIFSLASLFPLQI